MNRFKYKKVTILINNSELNDIEDFLMVKQNHQEKVSSLITLSLVWKRLVSKYDTKIKKIK